MWWSPNLSQFSLKNSFGKVVFQILAEIEMTRNENRLFGPHFETVQIFYFFSWNMVVISVCTYGVKIIKKIRWESGFLWGVPWNPPLCTNGSAGYLMQLSVNRRKELTGYDWILNCNTEVTHLHKWDLWCFCTSLCMIKIKLHYWVQWVIFLRLSVKAIIIC